MQSMLSARYAIIAFCAIGPIDQSRNKKNIRAQADVEETRTGR
jgi:hypothetical protein